MIDVLSLTGFTSATFQLTRIDPNNLKKLFSQEKYLFSRTMF